jgi:hypothetical protein
MPVADTRFVVRDVAFVGDANKAAANLRQHSVSFEQAVVHLEVEDEAIRIISALLLHPHQKVYLIDLGAVCLAVRIVALGTELLSATC